jgi:hypothetical protein
MSTNDQLLKLAAEVEPKDPVAASQLRSLASALEPEGTAGGWLGVTPSDVINVDAIVESVGTDDGPAGRAAKFEVYRNVLILFPIVLTWAGLFYAAMGYQQVIASNPELATEPFLLLWEQQFLGLLEPPLAYLSFLRLSTVAIIDVGVLVVVAILTAFIQRETSVKNHAREVESQKLRLRMSHALGAAHLELAGRSTGPAFVDSFKKHAASLVAELKAERVHLNGLADERERLLFELKQVTRDQRAAASDLAKFGAAYATASAQLDANVSALRDETAKLVASNDRLTEAVKVQLDELTHQHDLTSGNSAQLGQLATGMTSTLEKVLAGVSALGGATQEIRSAAEKILRSLADDAAQRRGVDDGMKSATAALAIAINEARKTAAATAAAAEEVTRAIQDLQTAGHTVATAASAGAAANADGAKILTKAVTDLSAAAERMISTTNGIASTNQESARALQAAANEMTEATKQVTRAVVAADGAARRGDGQPI